MYDVIRDRGGGTYLESVSKENFEKNQNVNGI